MAGFDDFLKTSGVMTPDQIGSKMEDIETKREAKVRPYLEASRTRTAKFMEEMPKGEKPAAPALQDLPEEPDLNWRDPAKAIGGLGTLLAVIASTKTRAPLAASMDAMANAIIGFHAGDKEKIALERSKFKDTMERALKQNQQELEQYHAALESYKGDWAEWEAKGHAIAAQNKDDQMMGAFESGNAEAQMAILKGRQDAADKLTKGKREDFWKAIEANQRQQEIDIQARNAGQAGQIVTVKDPDTGEPVYARIGKDNKVTIIPGATPGKESKDLLGEERAALQLNQLELANKELEGLAKKGGGAVSLVGDIHFDSSGIASAVGRFGTRKALNDEQQQVVTAAALFAEAAGHLQSGARLTDQQFQRVVREFIPLSTDGPETRKMKAEHRHNLIKGATTTAGRAGRRMHKAESSAESPSDENVIDFNDLK